VFPGYAEVRRSPKSLLALDADTRDVAIPYKLWIFGKPLGYGL